MPKFLGAQLVQSGAFNARARNISTEHKTKPKVFVHELRVAHWADDSGEGEWNKIRNYLWIRGVWYYMSKKSWPILCSMLLYKMG